jgi:hypothetical protein
MRDAEKTPSNEQLPSPLQMQASAALQFNNKLIHDFKDRADRHKRTFKLLRYSSVSLAIAVTLGSTLTATQAVFLWVIPILSGLSELSTTLLSSTNSQERWTSGDLVRRAAGMGSKCYKSITLASIEQMKKRVRLYTCCQLVLAHVQGLY